MNDYLSREPGNNESRPNAPAIDSDDLLDELWPGLCDEPTVYICHDCGDRVREADVIVHEPHERFTAKSFPRYFCPDCAHDRRGGAPRNEAAIRY